MKVKALKNPFAFLMKSRLVKSSFWGIAANGVQSILLSLFFVIMARQYTNEVFALFLIANTVYQFLAAFSTLGLGQWFTREIVQTDDKQALVNKFLKMQVFSGIFFYVVNIIGAYALYSDSTIRTLAVILGINIIFDNIIYAIRSLNVAEYKQQKTFVIFLIDSVLKFLVGCALFIYPLSVITLSLLLIATRFITLNIFLTLGSSNSINLKRLLLYKISFAEAKGIVAPNWAFVIIGSVSMIYWRIGNLIISKKLALQDVANYEVSYRIFSLALILPMILSTTVFPSLVELRKNGDQKKFSAYFRKIFILYSLYSLLVYTFFYSFSDALIPFAFGEQYIDNPPYTREMFLSVLIFPTALLQANVLVAMHKEKSDMWLNIVSLFINVGICFIGLHYYKSLSVINYAIFGSFLVFHICQDLLLYRLKVTRKDHIFSFYLAVISVVFIYINLAKFIQPVILFFGFWFLIGLAAIHFTIKFSGLKKLLKSPQNYSFKD